MKKIIYLLSFIILVSGCTENEQVEINDVISVIPSEFSSNLQTLNTKNKESFEGYSLYELTSKIKLKGYVEENKGKTYKIVIEDLVLKQKEIELEKIEKKEQKKKDKELAKKELPKMESKFYKNTDEINGNTWYTHKRFTNSYPNRKTLVASVHSSGLIFLKSNYYSSDWIFHTKIQVKVGEKVFETKEVKSYDDDNYTFNTGGDVWELVTFDEGNEGLDIIKSISNNIDKKVYVRFTGDKVYDETNLNDKDKIAIKESYELYKLLKKIN